MNLLIVQYLLPALLGYTLYAGIADRMSLRRPASLERRPGWLLGAGIGLTTSAVLAVTLTLGTGLTLTAAQALLVPAALVLAGLYTSVLIATVTYRRELHAMRVDEVVAFDETFDPIGEEARAGWITTLSDAGESPSSGENPDSDKSPDDDAAVVHSEDAPSCDDESSVLDAERALRLETEQHLRITRKALFVLENEAQQVKRQDDELLALESRLADGVRDVAAAQALAEREAFARIASETTVSEQREDLLKAQRDVRRNVEARARALTAANKALSHAKRSAHRRQRLEAQLEEAHATIANRQETISSLIKALEKEKRRTGEDVASLAKQLVLHERQLKARRSLEEVARSVEGKLTSRLVKKVAKARPVLDAG